MFYENYVRLCNSVNKTPSAVALEMGIAKPTVTRWKSGSKPNSATVYRVADYFGVTTEHLLEDHCDQKENPATESSEVKVSDEDLRHLTAFHAADEDTKTAIRLLLAKFQKENQED